MSHLFPIIRRQRRPLLPPDDLAAKPAATPAAVAPPSAVPASDPIPAPPKRVTRKKAHAPRPTPEAAAS